MKNSILKKTNYKPYLFILPAVVFFLAFILYPILFVGYGSFFEWSTLRNMKFVGLSNYKELLTSDKVFLKTLKNTFVWIITTVPIQATLGFTFAYIIEEKIRKTKGFFRTALFLPVVTSVVVVGIVWSKIYQPYQGILTNILSKFGIGTIDFLGNTKIAILSIILVNMWEWTGWSMLLYIAGINQIPEDIKEAAKIDGSTGIKSIFHIYLPNLMGTHKSLLMLGIIGSLQTFALIFNMTNGGPNSATEMPGTYIFKTGFSMQRMGYASAISIVILALALIATVLQAISIGSSNFIKEEKKK